MATEIKNEENRTIKYQYNLYSHIQEGETYLSFDASLLNTEVLISRKHFIYLSQYLDAEFKIKIRKSKSSVVKITNNQLSIEYSIIIDKKSCFFYKQESEIKGLIENKLAEIKNNIVTYLFLIKNFNKNEAIELTESMFNKRKFLELVKNESKISNVQLIKRKKEVIEKASVDIYEEKTTILHNCTVFGIINSNKINMTLKIQLQNGLQITSMCSPDFLSEQYNYEQIHQLKLSAKPVSLHFTVLYCEVEKNDSNYELIEILE